MQYAGILLQAKGPVYKDMPKSRTPVYTDGSLNFQDTFKAHGPQQGLADAQEGRKSAVDQLLRHTTVQDRLKPTYVHCQPANCE